MELTYTMQGDYRLPNLIPPESPKVGKYGMLRHSYLRKHRKIRLVYFTAMDYQFIENTGVFRLTTQFTVDSRQRVVGIFESV